jgi:hypothetical protein
MSEALGPDAAEALEGSGHSWGGSVTEKRSFERYVLWFPVTLDTKSQRVWAVCKDVSAGGILISGSDELSVGDEVTLSFRVSPETEDRRIAGRIVRVDPPDSRPRSMWPHRMAIEFLQPDLTLQSSFARASSWPPPPP